MQCVYKCDALNSRETDKSSLAINSLKNTYMHLSVTPYNVVVAHLLKIENMSSTLNSYNNLSLYGNDFS